MDYLNRRNSARAFLVVFSLLLLLAGIILFIVSCAAIVGLVGVLGSSNRNVPQTVVALSLCLPLALGLMAVGWRMALREERIFTLLLRGGMCRGCGYDLRYCRSAACPECGMAIEHSRSAFTSRERAADAEKLTDQMKVAKKDIPGC